MAIDSVKTASIDRLVATLINCCDIIQQQEINIINDLYSIDALDPINLANKDTKRGFYFHIIKGFCEYVDASSIRGSHVFYYSSCDINFLELTDYVETARLKQFLNTLTKHVSNLLPIKFYSSSACFDQVVKAGGEGEEHLRRIQQIVRNTAKKVDSLSRVRAFLSDNEFTYLDEKYFSKYKHIMFFNK